MKLGSRILIVIVVGLLMSTMLWTGAHAQEDMKKDMTGTNPINFKWEARVFNEFTWLNVAGGGDQNVTTLEHRNPLFGGKLQLRTRTRYVSRFKVDVNDDGVDDIDESGIGDVDFRLLMVPYLNMAKKRAMAIGLETFLNTASENVLGSGATSLGPQVFFVKFYSRGLFAPGFQYKFSVDEDEGRRKVSQILVDLNLLVMAKNKLTWFFTDPQIVFDTENEETYAIVDLEFGAMMAKWTSWKGQSIYIRPMFAVGSDRPVDYAVEAGYKFVF
jgi:hypothetical protein